MTSAIVVGSGPNGLAAAIRLARAGVSVRVLEAQDTAGGGLRTSELTLPGVLHDDCSAFHPTGVGSPFFASLMLERHGLEWIWPEVQLAHPLDDGSAGLLYRDLDATADGLGEDAQAWRRLLGQATRQFDTIAAEVFRPVLHTPRHPLALAAFGLRALPPATWTARRFATERARALFGGVCAHKFGSLSGPLSTSIGLMLTAAGHTHGWPVARGGSESIYTALAKELAAHGGVIETGVHVTDVRALQGADAVLLSLTPRAALGILGSALPDRIARAYRRYEYGPAAFKVDYAIEGDVPWTNEGARRAGTLHLGGSFAEVAAAEEDISAGRMPSRPFVLVGQQYLIDRSRSANGVNPVYAYAHVPRGWFGDGEKYITAQMERFAPGFRKQIRAVHVRDPADLANHNENYVDGDINVGANSFPQVVFRPRVSADPYATGIPGVFLCSSATPPGPGVHGMCGYHAAGSALKSLHIEENRAS